MTRWVLVAGDFAPHGGMDRANHALASFLARRGHPVELVTHRADPAIAALPGVAVRSVGRPFGSHFLGRGPLARAGKRAAREAGPGCRVVVNGGNCPVGDVNWVHYVHAAYRPDPLRGLLRRLKARIERPLDLRAEREAVRMARVVVCNSERTRRDVVERLGVDPTRTAVVYLGCDPEAFRPAEAGEPAGLRAKLGWPGDRPVVLFVGAPGDRRKGFDTLLAAWAAIGKNPGWDAVLVVVGHGRDMPVWERRAAQAGLGGRVRFLGFRTDVPDLLRAADAIVHPARYEPYGLGVHEALCCGLPVVVSASAGVAERYPPELGELLLSDPADANELADRLRQWRANLDALRDRVRPFAESLRRRTWDDVAADFLRAVGEPA